MDFFNSLWKQIVSVFGDTRPVFGHPSGHTSSMVIGGLLGSSAICLGAYGSHRLAKLDPELEEVRNLTHIFKTAHKYQMFHALAIFAAPPSMAYRAEFVKFLFLGVCLFSGSMYASIILDNKRLRKAAPYGGMVLMLTWLIPIVSAFKKA